MKNICGINRISPRWGFCFRNDSFRMALPYANDFPFHRATPYANDIKAFSLTN